jgi:threonine/homoserine/homoserine lactone efflux protein
LNISNNLSSALSCPRLFGHNFLVQRMRQNRNRRPYEVRSVTYVTGTLFKLRNTFYWTVWMNILSAFAHSTASWSSHLSMRIAQLVWGLVWTSQICMVRPLLWLSA